jgi:large subunit ribosomal protein L18e
MVRTTEFKNPLRLSLITELEKAAKKEEAGIWKTVSDALARSRKSRAQINLYRINKNTLEGDVVVVPGKVMGSGKLTHKVDVAAFNFTEGAKKEIVAAGGKVLSIPELIKKNAKGSGVKVMS